MAHAWRGRAVQSYCRGSTRYFLQSRAPGIPTTPQPASLGSLVTTGDQAAPLRAAPAMERRARAHASKRRGAHKHPRLPLLLQIHPLRSVARRARIGPTRTGLHRRGSARARGKGRERRADHLPHPLPHLASKRCRRRSFCTLPPPRVGRGPPPPRVNPPLPSPRRARASLPPPSLRSAHAPPLFRIPGPAGLLVARRRLPLTRPRPRATGAPLPLLDELGGARSAAPRSNLEPGHPPARRTRLHLNALTSPICIRNFFVPCV